MIEVLVKALMTDHKFGPMSKSILGHISILMKKKYISIILYEERVNVDEKISLSIYIIINDTSKHDTCIIER